LITNSNKPGQPLLEVATVFLKLGFFSFGGPAAHIAMMDEEIIKKRKWISREHFLDLIGATNLIPGPNSTEMALHCGRERAGLPGLIVAGLCFILPASAFTLGIAVLYSMYGRLPQLEVFFSGIRPALLSIMATAVFSLGRKALKTPPLFFIAGASLGASLLGAGEILVLLSAGVAGLFFFSFRKHSASSIIPLGLFPASGFLDSGSTKLFFIFLKIGSVLYGSGYVLFAFLDDELVKTGWMDSKTLLDAIAAGQFTPGPVLSAATFAGYQMAGFSGAAAATIGVFLPSFFFVTALGPLIPRLRQSQMFSAFLDAVNAASIALLVSIGIRMAAVTLSDWKSSVIAISAIACTFSIKRWNGIYSVLLGAILGAAFHFLPF